jgi:cytochrome c oxidase assembly factor CtaG
MSPALGGFLRSWPVEPWLDLALLVPALVYLRGWLILHRRDPLNWNGVRLTCFMGGLGALFLALASPLEPFSALLLQAHMVQHLLFMMVAPPLLWLGAPLFPIVRGLPLSVRTYWVIPLLRSRSLRRLFGWLTHPVVALPLFVGVTWLWHAPPVYDTALRLRDWHTLQHLCFLGSGLLFWYPVVRPYPSRPRWSRWLLFPYLILADVQNTVLSALLTFSDRVLYPHYALIPRLGGLSALSDQSAAGVIMWVPGSLAYLLPLFAIGIRLLFGEQAEQRQTTKPASRAVSIALPIINNPSCRPVSNYLDILRLPVLGRFLKWRHARLAMQLPMTVLAAVVVLDGLFGPQVGALNLAGVLPWIHWRGLLIFGMLVAGNVFCMACPFLLPRTLARRWLPARLRWPRPIRSKWLAAGLLALFLWAYEAFSLWDSPWWTAWIAIGYFVMSFVIDGFFRGASFCKYLCPIGQFNFVQSLVSPWEVKVRDPDVCRSCRTKECICGSEDMPGCEMNLYLPRKAGNLDCTFCLDCVHVCPHENIGILADVPGHDLSNNAHHSGIGRLAERPDLAALILLLVFGGFTNAAGMVAPVVDWQTRLNHLLGLRSSLLVTSLFYLMALIVLPLLMVGAATVASRCWGGLAMSWRMVATRFSYSLVPLGFGMWLSHYGFHFLTSYNAVIPSAQRFVADLGWAFLGVPEWACTCCGPVMDWLPRLELLFLDVGLLLTLHSGYWISLGLSSRPSRALKAFAPWALLSLFLFLVGTWIVLQPMQMRGTMQRMN